jgi:L-alanine-DL-glutamate epimerase-like enolase superfamily enzyme
MSSGSMPAPVLPQNRRLSIATETYPLAGRFTISRGSRTQADVVTAVIARGDHVGRGECVPYPRYGESVQSVARAMLSVTAAIERGATREELATLLPAGAARNAIDCALWDLEAKIAGVPAHVLAGIDRLRPVTTAYTLSLDTPEAMHESARKAAARPLLKIKLGGGDDDTARLQAVRSGAPQAELIVDANEGWIADRFAPLHAACVAAGVAMIEQPFPAGADDALRDRPRDIPICADESVHDRATLAALVDRYDVVNIKLDKTGGLTEALALADAAQQVGLGIMVGCMLGTSLAMAPALLLAGRARFVDLDGPLLLAHDRPGGLTYEGSLVHPPQRTLWG